MRGGAPPGPKKPLKSDTVRRVVQTFTPYRPQVIGITVAVLLAAVLGLLPPFLLQAIINKGLLGRNMEVVLRDTLLSLVATLGATALDAGVRLPEHSGRPAYHARPAEPVVRPSCRAWP